MALKPFMIASFCRLLLFSRKLTEVMIAYKIERELSKDQILESQSAVFIDS